MNNDRLIIKAYQDMMPVKDICKKFNINEGRLMTLKRLHKIENRGRVKGGPIEYEKISQLIIKDYLANSPMKKIAEKYKRSTTTINTILRKHGIKPKMNSDIYLPRFFKKIKKTPTCWIWQGNKSSNGYGRFKLYSEYVLAHRLSYEIHNGKIHDDLFVCHSCDVRDCINPDHLWLGTSLDNIQDCMEKGRNARGEKSGHALLSEQEALDIKFSTESTKVLRLKYNKSNGCITGIRSGKNWKHLNRDGINE